MLASFLLSKAGLASMAVAVLLLVFGIQEARLKSAEHTVAVMKAEKKAAEADVKAHEAQASVISSQASAGIVGAKTANSQRIVTLIKRIPYDVPSDVDADCRIVPGFVSLWNNAASPGPAVP